MKQRLVLNFPADTVDEPVTYNLIKDHHVIVNILNADVSHGKEGMLLIEISGSKENIDQARGYLKSMKIRVSPVVKSIFFTQDLCIHCGACSSVCYSNALNISPESRELEFMPEKCIACELCIKACPLQLFSVDFGIN